MKQVLLFIFCTALVFLANAQAGELIARSGSKGLYLEHKVSPKENFYSIGRAYNVNPKHIAAFNRLEMSRGLSIGQVIEIPLTDTNFNRKSEEGQQIYFKTSQAETISRISAGTKTSPELLRKWNHFSGGTVTANTRVIIGYLVTNGLLNLAGANSEKKEPDETTPVVEEEKKQPPIVAEKKDIPSEKTPSNIVSKKEEKKEVKETPVQTTQVAPQTVNDNLSGTGYFKASFAQQVKTYPLSKEETVTSGIFKTTSGWTDGKYYALIDGIQPGTIVKIVNPTTDKVVYAKVLGELSSIRQNQGLTLRISNAAASTLGVTENDKFIVKINY
jgi:hypothetical protein